MKERLLARIVVVLLLVCGISLMCLRYQVRKRARLNPSDTTWELAYDVNFRTAGNMGRLYVIAPTSTSHIRLYGQELSHPGSRIEPRKKSVKSGSAVNAIALGPTATRFGARFQLHHTSQPVLGGKPQSVMLSTEARAHYLRSTPVVQVNSEVIKQIASVFISPQAKREQLVRSFHRYCHENIDHAPESERDDAETTLLKRGGSPLGRARAMIALCRSAKIPARLVTGFELAEIDDALPCHWVEVYLNGVWTPYDPYIGYAEELPGNYVPVVRGSSAVVAPSTDVSSFNTRFSIRKTVPPAGLFPASSKRPSDILRLTRLPVSMRQVLALILLLPIGALINSLFRSFVGLRTFGIFSPTLLAVSFVFADWRTGLAMLAVMLVLAFIGRIALDRIRLLLLARLGIVLTILVATMVFAVSVLDYLGLTASVNAVLLPVVILTMIVERFYVTTEEDGWVQSVVLTIQTFVVAICCYLILLWKELAGFLVVYPEAHFITAAAFILVGRYTGYRLTELWRFRDLVKLIESRGGK